MYSAPFSPGLLAAFDFDAVCGRVTTARKVLVFLIAWSPLLLLLR